MMKRYALAILSVALLAFTLACSGDSDSPSESPARLENAIPAKAEPTWTPAATHTPVPTFTPEPTWTPQAPVVRSTNTPTITPAPTTNCHPNYPGGIDAATGGCIRSGVGDYDCSGGSGNGPNYVRGTTRVTGGDPFDLDRDNDGTGCD